MKIVRATQQEIDLILPLFDAYRRFYKRASDPENARRYLQERLERNQCTVFLALDDAGVALGFTLLYPMFTSVAMGHVWLLNDLFVQPSSRKHGVGEALMRAAMEMAKADGAVGLWLRTATDNFPAQALYERMGWKRDLEFYRYDLRF